MHFELPLAGKLKHKKYALDKAIAMSNEQKILCIINVSVYFSGVVYFALSLKLSIEFRA